VLAAVPVSTVDEFKERTARKLRDVRCPDHHQAPRLRFAGGTLRDITIQLSGCCGKLLGLANLAIGKPRPDGQG
jgi:hypothetical protein